MGNYYRTNLRCTRPELIASGSTFNQKINYEILGINDGEVQYISRLGTLHNEVLKISLQYPEEEFNITAWDDSEGFEYTKYSGVISKGEYKETLVEPIYVFIGPTVGQVDNSLAEKFADKISSYLDSVKDETVGSDNRIHYNLPDPYRSYDGLYIITKFIWETEDHRFIADNKYGYLIEIKYESKDKENLERLRQDNLILRDQLNRIDACDEYDELPF